MTFPQHVANIMFPTLLRLGWGFRYTDLGPFRAISRWALDRIDMKDRAFGWTIEMQIRAVEENLRIREIAVPYRKRKGRADEGHDIGKEERLAIGQRATSPQGGHALEIVIGAVGKCEKSGGAKKQQIHLGSPIVSEVFRDRLSVANNRKPPSP